MAAAQRFRRGFGAARPCLRVRVAVPVVLVVAVALAASLSGCFGPRPSRACSLDDPAPECRPQPPVPPPPRPDPACPHAGPPAESATLRPFFRLPGHEAARRFAAAFGFGLGEVQRGPEDEGDGTMWQIWFLTEEGHQLPGTVSAFWDANVTRLDLRGAEDWASPQAVERLEGLVGAGLHTTPDEDPDDDDALFLMQATPIGGVRIGSLSKFGIDFQQAFDIALSGPPVAEEEARGVAARYLACAEPDWEDALLHDVEPVVSGRSLAYNVEFRKPCADRIVAVDASSGNVIGHGTGGLWCG